MPSDVSLNYSDGVASVIANYWRLIAGGVFAAIVGVLLVRMLWLLLFRWAMKRATPNTPLQPTSGGKIGME
jgi:H+/Cl- antiporter ClcA